MNKDGHLTYITNKNSITARIFQRIVDSAGSMVPYNPSTFLHLIFSYGAISNNVYTAVTLRVYSKRKQAMDISLNTNHSTPDQETYNIMK
jgi:hypothetical protein